MRRVVPSPRRGATPRACRSGCTTQPLWAVERRMRPRTVRAGVEESTPAEVAAATVKIPTHILSRALCMGRGGSGRGLQARRLGAELQCTRVLEPPQDHRVRVLGAAGAAVVLGEAVLTPRYYAGSARERLII